MDLERKKWTGPEQSFGVHGMKATGNVRGGKNSVLDENRRQDQCSIMRIEAGGNAEKSNDESHASVRTNERRYKRTSFGK
jgi:hypothetical protein